MNEVLEPKELKTINCIWLLNPTIKFSFQTVFDSYRTKPIKTPKPQNPKTPSSIRVEYLDQAIIKLLSFTKRRFCTSKSRSRENLYKAKTRKMSGRRPGFASDRLCTAEWRLARWYLGLSISRFSNRASAKEHSSYRSSGKGHRLPLRWYWGNLRKDYWVRRSKWCYHSLGSRTCCLLSKRTDSSTIL